MNNAIFPLSAFCASLCLTGCQMCSDPISNDPSCVETSHQMATSVTPSVLAFSAPGLAPTRDRFRPVFRPGDKRISVIGSGKSLDEATSDAVSKFLTENQCDYIVATTRIISKKSHPTMRFNATTNYSVILSGVPLYLEKLVKEEIPVEVASSQGGAPGLSKEEIVAIIKQNQAPAAPLGFLKLSDIKLNLSASATTDDKTGVVFPAPESAVGTEEK